MPDDDIDPLAIDWCARAVQLRAVETAMLMNETVTEARFGQDMVHYATGNPIDLKRAIDEAVRHCQKCRGLAPKRTRYAIRGTMAPY